jgi:hypothetical protein
VLPHRGNYTIRQTVIVLDNGAQTHKLNRVPNSELADWDAKHDVVGNEIAGVDRVDSNSGSDKDGVVHERVVGGEKTDYQREV